MTKNISLQTNKTGKVTFKGFYGNYQINVMLPDGTRHLKNMHLAEKQFNRLEILL